MDEIRVVSLPPQDILKHMAADEALLLSVNENCAGGTLRVYQADSVSVTLGCFQKTAGLNIDFLNEHAIRYVRRITGGRTVLHGDDITFAFAGSYRSPLYASSIVRITAAFSKIVQKFFRALGIDVCISSESNLGRETTDAFCFNSYARNEMLAGDKKIVGFALKRTGDSFMLQGSIPVRIDHDLLANIFCDGAASSTGSSFTSIEECLDDAPGFDCLRGALLDAFASEGFSLKAGALSDVEAASVERLHSEKYNKPAWNNNPGGRAK